YRYRRQFDRALKDAQVLIDRGNLLGYSLRGRVYRAQRRYVEALDDFNKVLAEPKPLSGDYLDRAEVYFRLREFKRAREEADMALSLDSKSDYVYTLYADISSAMSDYQKALEYNNKAIALNPNEHENYCSRADTYINLKQETLALADLEKA